MVNSKSFINLLSEKMSGLKQFLFHFLLRTTAVVCVILFGAWGIKETWRSLTDQPVFKASPNDFSFHFPAWVTDRFPGDMKKIKGLNEHYGMYDNDLTQKIAGIYENVVLVKKVESVKRVFPNTLNIKLVLRKPAAVVRNGSNTYLVDENCVLLAKEYYTLPYAEYDSPCIQSAKPAKLPLLGHEWNDKGVKAGIALSKFLKANNVPDLFKICAIDVSNVCKKRATGRSDIILWTENNTQIRWGCSPLCKDPGELPEEEKLQNLLSVAKTEGTELEQMEYVDVRWKKPVGKLWAKANDAAGER